MQDRPKSPDKITPKDDDPIQSLQSKDNVVKREYQDNLNQIDNQFQGSPKSPKWRVWERSRKMRKSIESISPKLLSDTVQAYDVTIEV